MNIRSLAFDVIVALAPYEIVEGNSPYPLYRDLLKLLANREATALTKYLAAQPTQIYLDLPEILADPEATSLTKCLAAQAIETEGLPQSWRYPLLCAALQYLLRHQADAGDVANAPGDSTWTWNARYCASIGASVFQRSDVDEVAGQRPVGEAPWSAHLPAAIACTAATIQRYVPDPTAPPAAYEILDRDNLILYLVDDRIDQEEIAASEAADGICESAESPVAVVVPDEDARRAALTCEFQGCSDNRLLLTAINDEGLSAFRYGLLHELLIWGVLRYRNEWIPREHVGS